MNVKTLSLGLYRGELNGRLLLGERRLPVERLGLRLGPCLLRLEVLAPFDVP